MSARGRPRSFDRTAALERAMELFWMHGYEGVSMSDLVAAMGIASPSIYAAFGSKEQLFIEAVHHFGATSGSGVLQAIARDGSIRDAVAEMLRASIASITQPGRPAGCMIALGAFQCAAEHARVAEELRRLRCATEDALRTRLEGAVAMKELPAESSPAKLAKYFVTLLHGLSVQARDGASPAELQEIADQAMAVWDSTSQAA